MTCEQARLGFPDVTAGGPADAAVLDHVRACAACAEELADTFASASLDEWRRRLATLRAPWEVVQNQLEVLDDPQARANGYITEVDHPGGRRITVVRAPIQFDGALTSVGSAPELGAHTEEVLLEIGHDWDDIARYQEQGAIA